MTASTQSERESSQSSTNKASASDDDASSKKNTSTTTAGRKQPPAPRRQPIKYNNPAKIHMGKANIKRDCSIFVGIIGVLLLMSLGFGNVHLTEDPNSEEKAKVRDARELKRKMEEQFKAKANALPKAENEGCNLFLTRSSIPDVGQSLFAGQNFTKDDIIIESTLSYPVMTATRTKQKGEGGEDSVTYLPAPALLLKFHPHLANVVQEEDPDDSSSSTTQSKKYIYRATRPIQEGEEIFVSHQSYHDDIADSLNLFQDIPLPSDYELADQIALDAAYTQMKSKSNKVINAHKFHSSGGGNLALEMLQRSVSIFNERVAKILPIRKDILKEIKRYHTSTAFISMKNRTMWGHQAYSLCVNNVVEKDEDNKLIAKRRFQKRAVVATIPLYVMRNDGVCQSTEEGQECDVTGTSAVGSGCFGNKQLSMLFCPLFSASLFSGKGDFASKNPKPGQKKANARYQWSKENVENEKAQQLPIDGVLKNFATKLSIDIIATRIIEEGEEILLDFENGEMKDDMISSNWTTYT